MTTAAVAEWTVGPEAGTAIEQLEVPWSSFIPVSPTPKQLAFLLLPSLEALYGGSAGGGKLLSLDTPVPTPSGWATIGELKVGDQVFGEDGKPYDVTWVSPVDLNPESYRLKFDDGSTVECCADHLWLTFDEKELIALTSRTPEWRAARRKSRPSRATYGQGPYKSAVVAARNSLHPPPTLPAPTGTVRTTRQIVDTFYTRAGRRSHAIPVASALDTPGVELPLAPYVLGAWLGDGSARGGHITSADEGVIEHIRLEGWSAHKLNVRYAWRVVGLTTTLRQMGLLQNKHIPPAYLRGSIAQRTALLQGLMDTDGYCAADGRVEFCSTNKPLAEGVFELVVSLGQKPFIREKRAKLNGRDCGPVWSVAWMPRTPVFRLQRKLERQPDKTRRTIMFRYMTAYQKIAPRPMRCICVSNPSQLFLVGKTMIPTHNSIALLMAALQYVDHPGYSALILRKSYTDLALPGALMDKAGEWLGGTAAQPKDGGKSWEFPSGASLTFGYVETPRDKFRYQSSAFQFCAFDELTQHGEADYRYLFSRLRRLADSPIPIRMRAASNPGGIGHEWVRQRFLVEAGTDRVFLPASLRDNPHLDQEEYIRSLSELDPVTRRQLLDGDWSARQTGDMFRREWFGVVDVLPSNCQIVRRWDMAATEARNGSDPDWTAGALMARSSSGTFYLVDMRRARGTPGAVEQLVAQTARLDGKGVAIRMEQEPGSSGVQMIDHYRRLVLPGYDFRGVRSTGSKVQRAGPLSSQAEAGNIKLVRGPWINAFLDELEVFPLSAHDDQVDAASGALADLTAPRGGVLVYDSMAAMGVDVW